MNELKPCPFCGSEKVEEKDAARKAWNERRETNE